MSGRGLSVAAPGKVLQGISEASEIGCRDTKTTCGRVSRTEGGCFSTPQSNASSHCLWRFYRQCFETPSWQRLTLGSILSQRSDSSSVQVPRLSFRLAPEPSHLMRARERIRDYLLAHSDDRIAVDEVVLCVEEACTNAIRHSASSEEMAVSLQFEHGDLVVIVSDEGRGFDVGRFDPATVPDLMGTGGRGLYLIAQLMDEMTLRSEGGLEVRMTRRSLACRPSLPLDAALGAMQRSGTERRMRSLLEDISEAFLTLDWEYRIAYANGAALRLLGRSREEVVGHSIREAFPFLVEPEMESGWRQAMELGRPSIIEQYGDRVGWLEVRSYPTSTGVSVYLREINERKSREEEREESLEALRERVRLSEAQEVVAQLAHSTLGIDALIRRALDVGSGVLGAEAASVELRESRSWLVRYQRGLSAEALGAQLQDAEAPLAMRASQTKEPVVVEDVASDPEVNIGIIAHYGIRSCIVVPLVTQGKVEGCLFFHYKDPHRFTSAAIDYARKLSSTVSLALENSRLREREGEAVHVRSSLSDGRLGRLIAQSRVHPVRVLLIACLVEAAFLGAIGAATETREVFGLPGSLMALTVVIVGALAGSFAGVLAATFGAVVFYLVVADMGAKATAFSTALSAGIWIAAALLSSLLASGLRSQAERRREASVALASALTEREVQMAERERVEALAADLDAERGQLRTIIEQTDNSIVLLDPDFNFVLVNSAYAATCGYEPEAMVGLNHFALYPHEENEAIFRRVRDTGEAVEYVAKPFVFPDQPERGVTYWDWHLTPTMNDAGHVSGLVFSLVEVTERVRAQQLSETLNTINTVVNARLDPNRTMEEALRLAGEALDCEGGALIIYEETDELVATQAWNLREGLLGVRLPLSELPCAELALAEMRPVFPAPEVTARDEHLAFFTLHPAEGRIAIPLGVADEKLGVLVFSYLREHHNYGQLEADFAVKVGATVSQALENARLYEVQRHAASTLQAHLVHPLPAMEGIEFGRVSRSASSPAMVGGDFSDVFAIDDSRIVILIGDVAGKGLHAAGLTETVHTAVSSFALVNSSPGYVLRKTHDLLRQRSDDDAQFVTAFLAVLDPRTGEVAYASAGHPVPVRVGHTARLIEVATGVPLGTFDVDYPTQRLTLQEGEGLVLYTDGVTEARRDGELYGERRLLATVAAVERCHPRTIAEKLSEDAIAFGGSLKDDMQILAFRLCGPLCDQPLCFDER
jgi:PAS domain S-box-containing protein